MLYKASSCCNFSLERSRVHSFTWIRTSSRTDVWNPIFTPLCTHIPLGRRPRRTRYLWVWRPASSPHHPHNTGELKRNVRLGARHAVPTRPGRDELHPLSRHARRGLRLALPRLAWRRAVDVRRQVRVHGHFGEGALVGGGRRGSKVDVLCLSVGPTLVAYGVAKMHHEARWSLEEQWVGKGGTHSAGCGLRRARA